MRRRGVWSLALIVLAGLSAGPAMAAPAEGLSVGQLSVRLARLLGARLSPAQPEAAAAAFLNRHGLAVGDDLSRPVLAGDLIAFGRALGTSVTSPDPAAAATQAQAAAFVGAVRGSILGVQSVANGHGNGHGTSKEDDINASCRGREARDGREGTPASTADPNAGAPPCDGDEPTP